MKWKYHLQLYEPLYCSERPLFCMLQSTAKSFAPPLDGFSDVGSNCFLCSVLPIYTMPWSIYIHPIYCKILQFCFAALSQVLRFRLITWNISFIHRRYDPIKKSHWFLHLITAETHAFHKNWKLFFQTPFVHPLSSRDVCSVLMSFFSG